MPRIGLQVVDGLGVVLGFISTNDKCHNLSIYIFCCDLVIARILDPE